jgi:hypothetical protein
LDAVLILHVVDAVGLHDLVDHRQVDEDGVVVLPYEYRKAIHDSLVCHMSLWLFGHLIHQADKRIDDEREVLHGGGALLRETDKEVYDLPAHLEVDGEHLLEHELAHEWNDHVQLRVQEFLERAVDVDSLLQDVLVVLVQKDLVVDVPYEGLDFVP